MRQVSAFNGITGAACRDRLTPAIGAVAVCLAWLGALPLAGAGEVIFTPLGTSQGNLENKTGMWLRPDLGTVADVVPLKTRIWATQEAVTDGVAMKIAFEKGSAGKLAFELTPESLKAGTAGLTLYAKASRAVKMTVCGTTVDVGTDWAKHNFTWEQVGMTPEKPGWQVVVTLIGPIDETTTLILDRFGMEGPTFDPAPKLEKTSGPDKTMTAKELTYGAENLAAALAHAKAKKPFKVLALGDSVTAGAQMSRSTWGVKGADGVQFLYFGQVARVWRQTFGNQEISAVQHGHGGWTAEQGLKVVDQEIVAEAGADDVVILEFGANDMGWAGKTPEQWKADMKKLIARVKTKTANIIVLSPTTGGKIPDHAEEITKRLKEIVAEEKVCGFDVTRLSLFRGPAFGWAYLANEYHPDFCGHIMLGDLIATVLTGEDKKIP